MSKWSLDVQLKCHVQQENLLFNGSKVSLTCSCCFRKRRILLITWSNMELLLGTSRLPTNKRQEVYENGTLILRDVQKVLDDGIYSCRVLSPSGQTEETSLFRVIILGKLPLLMFSASRVLSWWKFRNKPSLIFFLVYVIISSWWSSVGFPLSPLVKLFPPVAPMIVPFEFPRSIQQGMRARLLCSIMQGDAPFYFTWFKDGRKLDPASLTLGLRSDDFSTDLTFTKVTPRHNGNYTCQVKNDVASISYSASLVVDGEWQEVISFYFPHTKIISTVIIARIEEQKWWWNDD